GGMERRDVDVGAARLSQRTVPAGADAGNDRLDLRPAAPFELDAGRGERLLDRLEERFFLGARDVERAARAEEALLGKVGRRRGQEAAGRACQRLNGRAAIALRPEGRR